MLSCRLHYSLLAYLCLIIGACESNQPPESMTGSTGGLPLPTPPPDNMLTVFYDSPLHNTDSLVLMGMFRPVGDWDYALCKAPPGENTLACDLRIPPTTTGVVLSVEAKGGLTTTYSCSENCDAGQYLALGALHVKKGDRTLQPTLVANGLSCGCNHEYSLR